MKKENKIEVTCSLTEAYLKGGIISTIICIPYTVLFILICQENLIQHLSNLEKNLNYTSILIIILIGTITHELIHGLTWAISSKKNISNIKFGFNVKSLTPYCHFIIPIKKTPYLLGTIMPFIILGLAPMLTGIIIKNSTILFWGILFTYAAAGDLICFWKIKKLESHHLYLDHPDKIGCIIQ